MGEVDIVIYRHGEKDKGAEEKYVRFPADEGDRRFVGLSNEGKKNAEANGAKLFRGKQYRFIYRVISDFLRVEETDRHMLIGAGLDVDRLNQTPDLSKIVKDSSLGLSGGRWQGAKDMSYGATQEILDLGLSNMFKYYFLTRADPEKIPIRPRDDKRDWPSDPRPWPVLARHIAAVYTALRMGLEHLTYLPETDQRDLIMIGSHTPVIDGSAAMFSDKVHVKYAEKNIYVVELTAQPVAYLAGEYIHGTAQPERHIGRFLHSTISLSIKDRVDGTIQERVYEKELLMIDWIREDLNHKAAKCFQRAI